MSLFPLSRWVSGAEWDVWSRDLASSMGACWGGSFSTTRCPLDVALCRGLIPNHTHTCAHAHTCTHRLGGLLGMSGWGFFMSTVDLCRGLGGGRRSLALAAPQP